MQESWCRRFPLGSWRLFGLVCVGSLLLGFLCTRGLIELDDPARYSHSLWLLKQWGFSGFNGNSSYTSVILEHLLGPVTEFLFRWVHDPYWVRHTINAALFPISLYLIYLLLRRAGVAPTSAGMACACVLGIIRLGGHALFNVKDPHYAFAFLLCTLYLWILLRDCATALGRSRLPIRTLLLLGIVSVVPFLTHFPDLLHFFVIVLIIPFFVLWSPLSRLEKVAAVLLPPLSGLLVLAALYPPFRSAMLGNWVSLFFAQSEFGWQGITRIFGITYSSQHVPWWYVFGWLPVILHPFTLIACAAGLLCMVIGVPPLPGAGPSLRFGRWTLQLTLRRWLWGFVLVAWAAFLFFKPTLYDEERHQLFLYVPTVLFCSLGLDALDDRLKRWGAAVMVVLCLCTYAAWGRYAYTYISPFIPDRRAEQFTGDYKGLCLARAFEALPHEVAFAIPVVVNYYFIPVAQAHVQRVRESVLFGNPDAPPYPIVDKAPKSGPYVKIVFNRFNNFLGDRLRLLTDVAAHKAMLLQTLRGPLGDVQCLTALYPLGDAAPGQPEVQKAPAPARRTGS